MYKKITYYFNHDDQDYTDLRVQLERVKAMHKDYFTHESKNEKNPLLTSWNKVLGNDSFDLNDLKNTGKIIELVRNYQAYLLCSLNDEVNEIKKNNPSENLTHYSPVMEQMSFNVRWLDELINWYDKEYIRNI